MAGSADRGVSHVIAVALLIAITTLLVGVMAVYVTGFGSGLERPAPNFAHATSFDDTLAANGQYLNVSHESGDAVDTGEIYVDVRGAEVVNATGPTGTEAVVRDGVIAGQVGDRFQVTETLVLNRSSFTDAGGGNVTGSEYVGLTNATVRIVFAPADSDRTDIVYECEVAYPDCSNH